MAERLRMFAHCECGTVEIDMANVSVIRFVDMHNIQCTKCWLVPNMWIEKEPNWPKLLRGL